MKWSAYIAAVIMAGVALSVCIGLSLNFTVWQPLKKTSAPTPQKSQEGGGEGATKLKPCFSQAPQREFLVEGDDVESKTRYPWMVKLHVNTPSGPRTCGGSVIDDLHVLTASHCLREGYPLPSNGFITGAAPGVFGILDVYVGGTSLSPVDRCFVTASAAFAPITRGTILNLDVAVIRLSASLTSAPGWNSAIAPIALPERDEKIPKQCEVSGWGNVSAHESELPTTLQTLDLQMYNFSECLEFENYKDESFLRLIYDEEKICSDAGLTGSKSMCQGDAGGPIVCNVNGNSGGKAEWKQFGIVSATDTQSPCGSASKPGYGSVHTSVPFVRSWIEYVAKPALQDMGSTYRYFQCLSSECKNLDYTLRYENMGQAYESNLTIAFGEAVCPAVAYYLFCRDRDPKPDRCKESSVPAFVPVGRFQKNAGDNYTTVYMPRSALVEAFVEISGLLKNLTAC